MLYKREILSLVMGRNKKESYTKEASSEQSFEGLGRIHYIHKVEGSTWR